MAWVIGDVHGCIKTLKALLNKIPKDEKIIFAGDLMDRGPNSREVIQLIKENNYDCVRGNHEVAMCDVILDLLADNSLVKSSYWVNTWGGLETLKSYNNARKEEVISDVEWLESLPYYIEYKDIKNEDGRYLVVSHSSIGDVWEMRNLDKDSFEYQDFIAQVTNNRINHPKDIKEIYNIHGHTPHKKALITDYYADADTGACYEKLGVLTAIEFPSLKTISQENIDN